MESSGTRNDPQNMKTAQARFEALVTALHGDVYRYAFWLCRNEAMAKDLVQETFMRAWRSFHNLRDETKAKSWLLTTVKREYLRQRDRDRLQVDDVEPDQLPAPSGAATLDSEVWLLRRAIAGLPEKYREPLVLQVIGGYGGDEIAEILNIRRATVDVRLFRARNKLRKILESHGDSETVGVCAR